MVIESEEDFSRILEGAGKKLKDGVRFVNLTKEEKEAVSLYKEQMKNREDLPLSSESHENKTRFDKVRGKAGFEINHITDLHATPEEFKGRLLNELNSKGHLKLDDKNKPIGVKDNVAVARLISDGFPLVIIGRRHFDNLIPYYVTYDYESIIREQILLARSKGHKKLVYFRSIDHFEMCEDRESALRQTCEKVGDMDVEVLYRESHHITPVLIESQMQRGHTLFVVESILYAEALQKAVNQLNLKIGVDLSATVFSEIWYPMNLSWNH